MRTKCSLGGLKSGVTGQQIGPRFSDWRRQAVVVNGAESHKDFWCVGDGNAEGMFGTRSVPCFWFDNGVAHGCPRIETTRKQGDSERSSTARGAIGGRM